ncbi:MAG: hypothetical protein ACR2PG_23465 [Hyphomicrobiaceae bacterium]
MNRYQRLFRKKLVHLVGVCKPSAGMFGRVTPLGFRRQCDRAWASINSPTMNLDRPATLRDLDDGGKLLWFYRNDFGYEREFLPLVLHSSATLAIEALPNEGDRYLGISWWIAGRHSTQ